MHIMNYSGPCIMHLILKVAGAVLCLYDHISATGQPVQSQAGTRSRPTLAALVHGSESVGQGAGADDRINTHHVLRFHPTSGDKVTIENLFLKFFFFFSVCVLDMAHFL